jgi:hypothetical protein
MVRVQRSCADDRGAFKPATLRPVAKAFAARRWISAVSTGPALGRLASAFRPVRVRNFEILDVPASLDRRRQPAWLFATA